MYSKSFPNSERFFTLKRCPCEFKSRSDCAVLKDTAKNYLKKGAVSQNLHASVGMVNAEVCASRLHFLKSWKSFLE